MRLCLSCERWAMRSGFLSSWMDSHDEMSPRGNGQAARNENKQEFNPFDVCSDSGMVSNGQTELPVGWLWERESEWVCVSVFIDAQRPFSLSCPPKDMAASALDEGVVQVSRARLSSHEQFTYVLKNFITLLRQGNPLSVIWLYCSFLLLLLIFCKMI